MSCKYNDETSRMFDKDSGTWIFFLSPRRRSGERTEERISLRGSRIKPLNPPQETPKIWEGQRFKTIFGFPKSLGRFMGRGHRSKNAPPLSGPLLHRMEEREWLRLRRAAISAVQKRRPLCPPMFRVFRCLRLVVPLLFGLEGPSTPPPLSRVRKQKRHPCGCLFVLRNFTVRCRLTGIGCGLRLFPRGFARQRRQTCPQQYLHHPCFSDLPAISTG